METAEKLKRLNEKTLAMYSVSAKIKKALRTETTTDSETMKQCKNILDYFINADDEIFANYIGNDDVYLITELMKNYCTLKIKTARTH